MTDFRTLPGSSWTGAVPGFEHLRVGDHVARWVTPDADPAATTILPSFHKRALSSSLETTSCDPERPIWRLEDVCVVPFMRGQLVFGFTIAEVVPGWRRLGPNGERVIDVLRALRSVTHRQLVEVAAGAPIAGRHPATGQIVARLPESGDDGAARRWASTSARAAGQTFQRRCWEIDHGVPGLREGRLPPGWSWVWGAGCAAAAAVAAGDALTETEVAQFTAPWRALGLPPSPEPWGPMPTRDEMAKTAQRDAFELIMAELEHPVFASPDSDPPYGVELANLWPWPPNHGGNLEPLDPQQAEAEPTLVGLPVGSRVVATWSHKGSFWLSGPGGGLAGENLLARWTLVRPDEPVLRDPVRSADLYDRLKAMRESWGFAVRL